MVRMNIYFFIFPFFYFWGKKETYKKKLGIEDYFIFLTFQTISKFKKKAKYRFQQFTLFFVFLKRTSKLEKWKNDQFSWSSSFFLYLKICNYDKDK